MAEAARWVTKLQEKYTNTVEFVLVYLREAHPSDGWNYSDWSLVKDPGNLIERKRIASRCQREFQFGFTAVVDSMDDHTAQRWSAWPERLFVVSREGRVVYTGDQGPFGFHPVADFPRRGSLQRGVSLESFLDAYLPTQGIRVSAAVPDPANNHTFDPPRVPDVIEGFTDSSTRSRSCAGSEVFSMNMFSHGKVLKLPGERDW